MVEQKKKTEKVTELISKEDEALFPTGPIVQTKPWIRGVNIGGWLVLERYISPYFFALTNCHVQGDFRFYPGQIDAPPITSPLYKPMNTTECKPLQPSYPVDMYTLLQAFGANEVIAKQWLNVHYENFVTKQDMIQLKEAGVLHVRVPIPHWILESTETVQEEPWVAHDGAWLHFKKLVGWCRELGIKVWPDVHTAPGSQNGFDNSGQALPWSTCHGWDQNPAHIQRSLDAIRLISQQLVDDGLIDVVTGLGLLNEPFVDCDIHVLQDFYNRGFAIVREIVGPDMAVYIGDMFRSHRWDNGFWTNDPKHDNPLQHNHELTFLDSHFYHVFDPNPRALSPRQHIAFVCRNQYRETVACCYEDKNDDDIISVEPEDKHAFMTGTVSKGISHIVGEWSAAFDTLVDTKLDIVMNGIAATGIAPEFDRQIPELRQKFLRNFVEAQMVTYEAATTGVSRGWFYWTLKME
jgi:glucan 1,3-beta-glucosidase